jgi:hypothetical protein
MSPNKLPEELEMQLDAVIRQIISAERKNYLDSGERVKSITANVKSIIEDNLGRVTNEN